MENFEANNPDRSREENEKALLSVREELVEVQEEISKVQERVSSIMNEAGKFVGDNEKQREFLEKMKEEEEVVERLARLNASLENQVDHLLEELKGELN